MCNEIEIKQGQTISIVFVKYDYNEDTDTETPVDFEGTYSFVVYSDPLRTKPILIVQESAIVDVAAITKTGNELLVYVPKADNDLTSNDYFYGLHNDIDAFDSYVEVQGTLIVKPSRKLP